MERIEFIKKFAVGGSILLTAPVFLNACSSDDDDVEPTNPDNPDGIVIDLDTAAAADLGEVGGYIYSGTLIVFRTGENTYLALSKACTHSGCDVVYSHSAGNVPCPCHGSEFTTSGAVTKGPASSNLKRYTVKKEGNMLKIS